MNRVNDLIKFTIISIEHYLIAIRNHARQTINVNYKKTEVSGLSANQKSLHVQLPSVVSFSDNPYTIRLVPPPSFPHTMLIESTPAALLEFNFTKGLGQFNKIFTIITPCKFLSLESKLFKSLPKAFRGVFVRTIAANASKSSFTNENGLVWTGEIKTNTLGVVGHILLRFRRYF